MLTEYPIEALDLDFDAAVQRLPERGRPFVTTMFARTRYIDDTMKQELQRRARQVVILGAGFDSHGYRFRDSLGGATFFEVDYGPTQDYKQRRVERVLGSMPKHVRYVPVDFTKDDLLSQLRKSGCSERKTTLFIWEGVTAYLPESAIKDTLHFVRDHSGPGSAIIFDYTLSRDPNLNNPNTLLARWGELVIFGFRGESAADYVRREGLTVLADVSITELVNRYARRGDGTSSLPPLPSGGGLPIRFCTARVP